MTANSPSLQCNKQNFNVIKKHFLPGIIALMTISLMGIIAVQYFWIKNAIRVKEQQFDRSVSQALNQVVQRLKKDQDVLFISNHVWTDDPDIEYKYSLNDSLVWSTDGEDAEAPIYVRSSSSGSEISTVSIGTSGTRTVVSIDALENDTLRHKAILKLDSIRDVLDEDQFIVLTELKDSLDVIVKKTLSGVRQKRVSVNEAIDEMVVELKSIDERLDNKITAEQVSLRLDQSLEDEGIGLAFEFGIYNPDHDSLTSLRSEGFEMDGPRIYKTRMFPESIFDRPELLLVSFPGRSAEVIRSMGWLLSGSVLFTLIIILTFFITIRVILRQKKLSDIKSDFINNMTHEFKTPIATISLAADSINNPSVISSPEKIRYFTGVISEENKRMNARVENVLQMSLIDSQDFNLRPEEINIHEIISQVARNIELQVKKKNGKVTLDLQAGDPVIMADKIHMTGILTNLLDNALKYSADITEIGITTRDAQGSLILTVADKGIGMTKEEQIRIFDKFYRVPRGDIHNVKGFGLGLSYVKAIVLAMKGEIDVKSQVGKGSSFRIKLPKGN